MVSFEKKEKNFVVIICNYSVCKVKGNESEMVHCLLCGMGSVSYTHSPSPRDPKTSRMPSSA